MSRHHEAVSWTGSKVKKARGNVRAMLPMPCVECGKTVTDEEPWDVGHIIPLALGGDHRLYGAAHRFCNRSAGGKLGARKTNHVKKNTREW